MAYSMSGSATAGVGMSNELTMTFSDYGKNVDVSVPTDAETFDATGEAAKSISRTEARSAGSPEGVALQLPLG